jgi:hypothetical protein
MSTPLKSGDDLIARDRIYEAAAAKDGSQNWSMVAVFILYPLDALVAAAALDTLVTPEKAAQWLTRPLHVLGGIPVELAQTAEGRRAVLSCLGRLEHGVFS